MEDWDNGNLASPFRRRLDDEALAYLERVIVTLAAYPRLFEFYHFDVRIVARMCVGVCVFLCDVCGLCACMHMCVVDWHRVLARTEFGVPEHLIGNLCVVALSRKCSPFFDAFLRRRHACKLPQLDR